MKGFNNYQTLGDEKSSAGHPNRSIPARVKEYRLLKYIGKKAKVLDIGCNRGFFGIHLADKIGRYIGIDHDANELSHGDKEIAKQELSNVNLINVGFEDCKPMEADKFDAILSLAVHVYVKMSAVDYVAKINKMLTNGGYLFLEGHPTGYMGEPAKLDQIKKQLALSMTQVYNTTVKDRDNKRDFTIWKK